jgi:uncharacterized membrane protein
MATNFLQNKDLKQILPYIYILAGVIGLIAAFALTYDKLHLLSNPAYQPSCNINPILSCQSVMQTEQANLFGLPNTIFGIMGFSILATLGLILLAKAKFSAWFWLLVNAGAFFGFLFSVYLFFQGVYRINAICPYCFIIWMITPLVFWYTTIYNLKEKNLKLNFLPANIKHFIISRHLAILAVWYVLIFSLLLTHFWYYWKTLV